MKFRILREESKAKNRITTLNFINADFGLFMNLLERILQDTVLERCPGKLADFQGSPSPSSRTGNDVKAAGGLEMVPSSLKNSDSVM